MTAGADTLASMSDQMLRELRDVDRGIAEVKGQLASLPGLVMSVQGLRDDVAAIGVKVTTGADADSDKEKRLRTLEEWKATMTGKMAALVFAAGIAAAIVTKLVTV